MTSPANFPPEHAKTSTQAVWSLVFGILSLTCLWLLGSVPAIVLGILAIKAIDQSGGTLKGRGLGLAGIITGGVGVFAGIAPLAIVASLALPVFTGVQDKAISARQSSDMRQLIFACKAFAAEHNGNYPGDLEELVSEDYLYSDDLLYAKPSPSTGEPVPYLYRPGLGDDSPSEEPLLASPLPIQSERIVGYCDGSVAPVPEAEFQLRYRNLFP